MNAQNQEIQWPVPVAHTTIKVQPLFIPGIGVLDWSFIDRVLHLPQIL